MPYGAHVTICGQVVSVTDGRFSLVQSSNYENKDGDQVNKVIWINVFLTDKQEETIGQYIVKGAVVTLSGGQITPFQLPEDQDAKDDKYDFEIVSSVTIEFPQIHITSFGDDDSERSSGKRRRGSSSDSGRRSKRRSSRDDDNDNDERSERRSSRGTKRKSRRSSR